MTRRELLGRAVDECMEELYKYVQPKVEWEDFLSQSKAYSKMYEKWEKYHTTFLNKDKNPKEWEQYKEAYALFEWEDKDRIECIGPAPFEFYYLPSKIMRDICDHYISIYKLDSKQNLLDTIEILKNYCKEPIVDKYIPEYTDEYGNRHPGHRGYEHPDNLVIKLIEKFSPLEVDEKTLAEEVQDIFFEFLDMAGNFYNWNSEYNAFNMSVYLGCSPNSNKEAVIKNWSEYRNIDIDIDEEQIKKDYYGEDEEF